MSLPFYSIKCSGCSFADGYNLGTRFIYKGSPEKEPSIKVAWCKSCDAIVRACAPYTKKDAGSLKRLSRWEELIVLGFKEDSIDDEQATREFLTAKKMRLTYFELNPYPTRCMVCGGHDVFPLGSSSENYDTTERTGVTHSCGGELLICMAGSINFASYGEVFFDENGLSLKERG